jgi:hypothetical protein
MISTTLILLFYSIISSVIIVVLSALYHGCGSQATIRNNSGEVDQRVEYDFGLINESVNNEAGSDDQCHCWSGLELTILEMIVIGVLCIAGIGLAIKLMIHAKSWIMIKTARHRLQNEQRKQIKAEKMRKLILEEYRSSIPAHEVQEGKEEP